jgi:hypothetical protein
MTSSRAAWAALLAFAAMTFTTTAGVAGEPRQQCIVLSAVCYSSAADHSSGQFRGLIAINGDASLLKREASLAGSNGCDDCLWQVTVACQNNEPGDGRQSGCRGAVDYPTCRKRQLAERIFLARSGTGYGDVGIYCLGRGNRIVPIGEIAKGDVERYLKDVRPPNLTISFDPGTSLAGLATKVRAAPDRALRPVPFGGQGVTETIKLAPVSQTWNWGDGQTATFTEASIRTSHTYATGGHLTASVTTTWGATYTLTYQGLTFGPYDATGRLTGRQTRAVTVVTSTPVLVSH